MFLKNLMCKGYGYFFFNFVIYNVCLDCHCCLSLSMADLFSFFPFSLKCVVLRLFLLQFCFSPLLTLTPHTISGCPAFRTLSSSCSFGEFTTSAFPLQAVRSKFH